MITFSYIGGIGNMLFQYAYARLLAETNGFQLRAVPPPTDLVNVTACKEGVVHETPVVSIDEDAGCLLGKTPLSPGHYHLNGFFQHGDWYVPYIDRIRGFMSPAKAIGSVNTDDIVLHLRLGDYPFSKWISPKWYYDVLKSQKFRKLYVVTADPQARYINALKEWSPEIVPIKDDNWDFLRSFSRVIISNSTYCWWAVFFGKAQQAFSFKRWMEHPNFQLSVFPGLTPVDGLFDIEVPR